MIIVVLGYAAFEVSVVSRSQHLFEPLRIFDQYVSAGRAAERCGGADEASRLAFRRNLEVVERRAREDWAEAHPEESTETIARRIAARARDRESEVDARIADVGCDGLEVWELLKFHEQRARQRLR